MSYITDQEIAQRARNNDSLVYGGYSSGGSSGDCCSGPNVCCIGDCGGGGGGNGGEACAFVAIAAVAFVGVIAFGAATACEASSASSHSELDQPHRSEPARRIVRRYTGYHGVQAFFWGSATVMCLFITIAAFTALYAHNRQNHELVGRCVRGITGASYVMAGLVGLVILRWFAWYAGDQWLNKQDAQLIG
jgi:hypothetical protein